MGDSFGMKFPKLDSLRPTKHKYFMQPPVFDLHKLGWKAFEDLIACVSKEILGQTFQIFSEGADGGRDGAFHGKWDSNKNDSLSGNFTIQCKHTGKTGKTLSSSIIEDELIKISRLTADGLCDVYLLFTNYNLPAEVAASLENAFEKAGAKHAKVFGAEWINNCIASHPTLRRLVPRLYGLGDLTQIVTHQAYTQARGVLDSLATELACFVPTEAYRQCAHALKEYGFVILIGEPASGKTTIANLMALSAADEWDLQTLILNSPTDFDRLWDPDEPKQFFWVDDAFGSNQYDPQRVQEWNQRLSKLNVAIKQGARAVFTSRSYIFNSAKDDLNIQKFELFNESRVVIEVEKLSEIEKSMILYNHLKFGLQPKNFLTRVIPHLPMAVTTAKFLPEIARRFANPKFTSNLNTNEAEVKNFFVNPVGVMEEIIKGLASAEKAAIALIFVNGGSLSIPLPEDEKALKTITAMRSNIGDVKAALLALQDSLLRLAKTENNSSWQFHHPTIRDAFASFIGNNPEQLEIYLSGVTKERLISEVSCGNMNVEGVKIIIPATFFDAVLTIIRADHTNDLEAIDDSVLSFLANKCSAEFLKKYFSSNSSSQLARKIKSPSSYDAALKLITKLNKINLLSDETRRTAIERIRRLADVDYWPGFAEGILIGELITEAENTELLSAQKDIIFSNQDEIISEIVDNFGSNEDPEDAFFFVRRLVQKFFEESEQRYPSTQYDVKESLAAQRFIHAIENSILELKAKQSETEDYDSLDAEDTYAGAAPLGRSIFDDLDD